MPDYCAFVSVCLWNSLACISTHHILQICRGAFLVEITNVNSAPRVDMDRCEKYSLFW